MKNFEKELIQLSIAEIELSHNIVGKTKDPLKVDVFIPRSEIFESYSKIHEKYTNFSSQSIEALKRAVFIQWYEISEPEFLTGIANLKLKNISQVFINLEKRLNEKNTDNELLWMLNYYFSWDNIFDHYKNIDLFNYKKYNFEAHSLPENFKNIERGQMGDYWDSIINR